MFTELGQAQKCIMAFKPRNVILFQESVVIANLSQAQKYITALSPGKSFYFQKAVMIANLDQAQKCHSVSGICGDCQPGPGQEPPCAEDGS